MTALWVLTYHSISDGARPLCIAADRFAAQLDSLLEAGWAPVPIGAAFARPRPGGPARAFAVSFDDGYRDFARTALPLLEERRIPSALFATASTERGRLPGGIADRPLLDPAELRELADAGVEVGGHGVDHRALTGLDDAVLARELRAGRERLAEWTGRPVRYLAYPFGAFDDRVVAAAEREYAGAFTTQLAPVPASPHPHAIPRVDAYYLHPRLARSVAAGRYLSARRLLRRLRGSEPRRPLPDAPSASSNRSAGTAGALTWP